MGINAAHLESAARRKLGASADWKAYRYEVISDCVLVAGMVPAGYTKKGRPKWKGQGQRTVLTPGEIEAEVARYEETTGNCSKCIGTGQVFKSWSQAEGLKTVDCPACGATGKKRVKA